ncbi:MAG: hypothetical protein HN353_04620 [Bdellovibrionales bacterium]|jgi:hypothetical protein|nr:hypothetical protein [Bdellovibrionales bacterium]MBT3527431.1 hypothetical protein [Bdellovibrionales bacterium]MBT7668659.1 hypothetical protein [Bdellovibrionales bacterium]MBT7767803.1 hypothetical protein [Bdellovibrionales bacterium]
MTRENIKLLTFASTLLVIFCLQTSSIYASVLSTQKLKTHLRWKLKSQRNALLVSSLGDRLLIKSQDLELMEQLNKDLSGKNARSGSEIYLGEIKKYSKRRSGNGIELEIPLANDFVDIFSFYNDSSGQMIIDFWLDQTVLNKRRQDVAMKLKIASKAAIALAKRSKKKSVKRSKALSKKSQQRKIHHSRSSASYRDFRYGAPIIWDYPAYRPHLETLINLKRKTPEYFYPLTNRQFEKNESEAHLQLTLNLYRRKKWGLMYKSIQLYQTKYGDKKSRNYLSYLKANALIRINLEERKNSETPKNAISILTTIVERPDNYQQQRAIYKYLIAYFMEQQDYVQALNYSKSFYVAGQENKDKPGAKKALELILVNLAHNGQLDSLKEVIGDKAVQQLLPRQLTMAYELFVLLKLNRPKKVISRYKEMTRNMVLASPVNPAILFNIGEAFFRIGRYQSAVKYFDQFIHENSMITRAADARLRVALSYEILDRDIDQTLELYHNAINRSQDFRINYEARLRYVALRTIRKLKTTPQDLEVRSFLNIDELQRQKLGGDLKTLLWLVRLRSYLVDQKWGKALTYLNAVPLATIRPSVSRIFHGDGAEIVYGIIDKNFRNGRYSTVIKTWEVFKDRYIDKVLMDTYLNFIVARSYLGIKLTKGYQRAYQSIVDLKESPPKTYPIWVKRVEKINVAGVLGELNVLKRIAEKEWDGALAELQSLIKSGRKSDKFDYYSGLINYKLEKLPTAIRKFESYFAHEAPQWVLDSQETAMLIDGYLDSLYRSKRYKKFMRVSEVVLRNVDKMKDKSGILSQVLERVAYLRVEMMAGESDTKTRLLLESEIIRFQKKFSKSVYRDRTSLILGTTLIKIDKEKEGRKILRQLSDDKEVSSYIRELARSELTFLEIKNKTI